MLSRTCIRKANDTSFWRMFTNPIHTLASLRDRPAWLAPALVSSILSALVNLYLIQRVGLARMIETAGRSGVVIDPQATIQSALMHQQMILTFQSIFAFVGSFLTILVIAKVISLVLTLCGKDTTFRIVLAIVSYAVGLSSVARECLLALTAILIQNTSRLDLRNPLATNPAFFLRPRSAVVQHLLASLDVITIATIVLLVAGLTRVCERLTRRAAASVVIVPWIVYVGITTVIPSFWS